MTSHPYSGASPHRLWRSAVTQCGPDTDPVTRPPFRISPTDKVMTAGSCFAQHISQRLKASGFGFLVTEPAHPLLPDAIADAYHYARFTARYGNVYTARQLRQLLERAYGRLIPQDAAWVDKTGRWVDALRPLIQPAGFGSRKELEKDRQQHLAAVRKAFETLDVLVFTLGLTEAWESKLDGTVYPACPGTAGGVFDANLFIFHNQSVDEVVTDLSAFVADLRTINPAARIILTVSPVPLVATATAGHVLQATTYSKAVLRVAVENVASRFPDIAYFPSYEIITGPQTRGRFFAEDLRSVTPEGVDRVMALFFRHMTDQPPSGPSSPPPGQAASFTAQSRDAMDLLCDEERLDDGR
jgi:hypothetical protein